MRTRGSVLFLVPALALLGAPAVAQTVPPPRPPAPLSKAWARTAPVATPVDGASQPTLTFAQPGHALIGWSNLGVSTRPRGQVAAWTPGTRPVAGPVLPGFLATAPVPLGGGRALLVVERPTGRESDLLVRLSTAVRSASGRIGAWRALARYGPDGATTAAVSRTGEVALAWIEARPAAREQDAATFRLRLAIRPPGRRFRAPVTVASLGIVEHPGYVTVAAAYDAASRLVIVAPAVRETSRRTVRDVLAFTGRPDELRRRRLGPHSGVTDVLAGTSRTGRAVVAWATQDGGEEANRPQVVRAAIRGRGAPGFGRARVVDPGEGRARAPGRIALAVGRDGTAVLTWSQLRGMGFPLRHPVVAATALPGRPFDTLVELDADGAAGDVAIAPDGGVLVVWSRILRGNEQEPDQVFAAFRAPGAARFDASEAVSEADVATRPAAAWDPATGRPAVVWSERPGDAPPPEQGGGADAVIRAAVRTG